MNLASKIPLDVISIVDCLKPEEIQDIFTFEPSIYCSDFHLFSLDTLQTGETGFFLNDQNVSYFTWFYPLYFAGFLKSENLKTVFGKKTGYGLGTLAHVNTIIDSYEKNNELLYSKVDTSSNSRNAHLLAMKIPVDTLVPFKDYALRSVDYSNKRGFNFSLPF